MKRTLRMLYFTLFEPETIEMRYLISTTRSINELPDETARMLGFESFVEFAQYMWPFDAPIHIRTMFLTNMFRIDRNNKLIATLSYSGVVAEIPTNRYYVETPILIPVPDPTLTASIVSLASSKII